MILQRALVTVDDNTINQKRKKKLAMKISLTINWFFTDPIWCDSNFNIYIWELATLFWAFVEKLIFTWLNWQYKLPTFKYRTHIYIYIRFNWLNWHYNLHTMAVFMSFLVLSTQWTNFLFLRIRVIGLFNAPCFEFESLTQKEVSVNNTGEL